MTIHLGYEVGTGSPVSIPLLNTAVTGQTQQSGKTTTLEALVSRSDAAALAFVTKRGESAFNSGRRVAPYFRDRADWQFVTSIIDATLQEKNKFLRPWIMNICRTTQTLAEVQAKVREALRTAKGINQGVYTQLDAYLDLIVPEIKRAKLATSLDLQPGLNVMDVSGSSLPMQMLFVQSAIEWVNEKLRDTIVIVPEAWEFVPEGKGSPVKAAAIGLVRKGSGLRNHIWVDSQDMAGVDKTILRGCPVWLIGVQREANEIKRNLANIPAGITRPTAAEIATLKRGQFYACFHERTVKVYVQPAWLSDDEAQAIARGAKPLESPTVRVERREEPEMCEQHQQLEQQLQRERTEHELRLREVNGALTHALAGQRELERTVASMRNAVAAADDLTSALRRLNVGLVGGEAPASGAPVDEDAIVRKVLARIPAGGAGPVTIMPPEALRADFQRQEVDRLLTIVKALKPLQKRVLKLMETTAGEYVGQPTLATRLGRTTAGGSFMEFGKANKELAELGLVEAKERQGLRKRLRDKIAEDLAFYQASEADIEAVYQNVLHTLVTEE